MMSCTRRPPCSRSLMRFVALAACWTALALGTLPPLAAQAPAGTAAKPAASAAANAPKANAPEAGAKPDAASDKFRDAFAGTAPAAAAASTAAVGPQGKKQIQYFELLLKGGPVMIPIGFMSFLVVVFSIERFIALRASRVAPPEFVQGLGQLAARPGGLDPRLAYRLCQKHRSPAARVVRAALLKVGRPHQELEKAVADACDREATDLYANVRHINLAMAVSPLLGLLGTVWGMVETFFDVSQATQTVKVSELADGIYVALVTTVAGLVVAIPAALASHYFEGRIQALFRIVQDLVDGILPQLERYEGKLRVSLDSPPGADAGPGSAAQPGFPAHPAAAVPGHAAHVAGHASAGHPVGAAPAGNGSAPAAPPAASSRPHPEAGTAAPQVKPPPARPRGPAAGPA